MTQHKEIEEGLALTPRFDANGLIAAIAQDATNGEVLMLAWMNAEALQKTIQSKEAWYYSRSRQALWHKGATSGQIQSVQDILIDCDQDAVVLKVTQSGGGACHTGRKSCFYRQVDLNNSQSQTTLSHLNAKKTA